MHPVVAEVLERIQTRSKDMRAQYLEDMLAARRDGPARAALSCANLAHSFAASGEDQKGIRALSIPNIGIVTSFNDMLSAHQPFEGYPEVIRLAARAERATAQVAGGVPAMCDGVTQGRAGMELSLFSRDVIAMATAISLSHDAFDAVIMLGVCDKIVPGMIIAAARFGHLPTVFVPAGPMPSGIPNPDKAKVRKRYAVGEATREELLEAEAQSYHAPGTCTFYGTANSNQFLMEAMGLHVPGAAFVAPNTPLREALTREAVRLTLASSHLRGSGRSFADVIDARSYINAVVALLASGGSTNHAIHLVAMARASGILLDWEDLSRLSSVTPLLARIYPNGVADVNHFQAAGGTQFMIRELMKSGLMIGEVKTMATEGLAAYTREPFLKGSQVAWRDAPAQSLDQSVLKGCEDPFDAEGGLKLVAGNLGRAIVKVSAVPSNRRAIVAPARVFNDQAELSAAVHSGQLDGKDFIAVVRFQGPRANGMPELHSLTPPLSVLQDRGQRVALLTDGRMSGASGAILAAIHVTPEAYCGGALAKVRDGDVIRIDPDAHVFEAQVNDQEWNARPVAQRQELRVRGAGRDMFARFRAEASSAEEGGSALYWE
ncbi:MAG: phosphogluconate dehydratase [Caulobacterales bacterium]